VVTSKTNNLNQIDVKISISNTVSKAWLKEISGYDENDSKNGYAGVIGEPMTSLRIDGGKSYRVHSYNTKSWLEKVNGNNMNDNVNGYAGVKYGDKIDAIVIGGGVEYAIHTLGGVWLPPVSEYNITDSVHGYAGNIGQPIDAIMIKGRTYATSIFYNETLSKDEECNSHKGTCMNPIDCVDGLVLNNLCSGGEDNKCCIPNIYLNNSNTSDTFDPFSITVIIIFALVILVIILYYCYVYYKNWIRESISFTIENHPSIVKDEKNSLPNYEDIVDAQVVDDEQSLIINPSTSLKS